MPGIAGDTDGDTCAAEEWSAREAPEGTGATDEAKTIGDPEAGGEEGLAGFPEVTEAAVFPEVAEPVRGAGTLGDPDSTGDSGITGVPEPTGDEGIPGTPPEGRSWEGTSIEGGRP